VNSGELLYDLKNKLVLINEEDNQLHLVQSSNVITVGFPKNIDTPDLQFKEHILRWTIDTQKKRSFGGNHLWLQRYFLGSLLCCHT